MGPINPVANTTTMGYITSFYVTIVASPERKLQLAKHILDLGCIRGSLDVKDALEGLETFDLLKFEARWYEWKRDAQGNWWDVETKSIRIGINLEDGESLSIEGFGDDDIDIWKAFVSKRKFSVEYCHHVEWHNKSQDCGNVDEGSECTGCQACSTRIAVWE